jgi:putative transposase
VKSRFIKDLSVIYFIRLLCRVMQVSHSAYYDWRKRSAKLISAEEQHLYRRMKQLFAESLGSLGSERC